MAHADLYTRCTHCRGEIRITREAAQYASQATCPYCGTTAYIWQLIGRANREELPVATDMNGTWEWART